jgi:hypothetical protein
MAYFPNSTICLDSTGHLQLQGDTGISAACKAALAAIIGQKRIIPIFLTCTGNGNNAIYDIVAFVGVEICDVRLTGSMSTKCLTVQPCKVYTMGGVANTSSTVTTSYYVYSPIHLVK